MGGMSVVNGANLMCTMGVAPAPIMVTPENKVLIGNQPAANIMDHIPMKNIMPFGVCKSIANPQVAAATAAALGVLTPMPCVPNTVAPWAPGSPQCMVGGKPAVNNTCQLMCTWAGVITVSNTPATTVQL